MNKKIGVSSIALDGLIFNNPIFVQLLGMCSTLAVSTSVINAVGMGLAVTFVLACSNLLISLLRNFVPQKIRIAAYVIIIAGFVTVVDLVTKAYLPALSTSLGIFIPLIVVNCIILARAESFASKNKSLPSLLDGVFSGLGFTLAIFSVSFFREILGGGSLFGFNLFGIGFKPALVVAMPAGGFITLGLVIALVNFLRSKFESKKSERAVVKND